MPSAVQLVGRIERQFNRLSSGRLTAASARAGRGATIDALDALEGTLDRGPDGPFSNELSR